MSAELLKPSELLKDSLLKNSSGDCTSYLHSVVYSLVIGQNSIEDFVQNFKDLLNANPNAAAIFLDCIWLVENELALLSPQNNSANKQQHLDRLGALVRGISNVIPSLVRERLDPELLEASKLIQSKDIFSQKIVRVKTRLFYKQQKFNLLREESEGYSKLIAELANPVSGKTRDGAMRAANYLRSLIGCFGLDPNRVVDLVLESYMLDIDHSDFFIQLLHSIINDRISMTQILGRKFSTPGEASPSSAAVAAKLIIKNLVDMDALYCHLSPSDAEIAAKIQSDLSEAKLKASNMNVISLGGASKSADDDGGKGDNKDGKTAATSVDPHAYSCNHKLMLLQALLSEGAWNEARTLLDHLTPAYAMSSPEVSLAMARLISSMIAPLSDTYHGLPSQILRYFPLRKSVHSLPLNSLIFMSHEEMLSKGFFGILSYIGPYMSRSAELLIRLLRIFSAFMQTVEPTKLEVDSWQAKFYFQLISAFEDVILPSLSLMPANCVVSDQIWQVLKQMPYMHRYALYGSWASDSYQNIVPLIMMRIAVTEKCRYSVKRVTKDNFKQIGRQLGKLSHANPGPVIDHLLNTVQKFDNFIGPLIDSLRYMTPLSFDMMAFSIMKTLAEKGSDQSDGATALCSFTGQLVRRYNCEIAGLLQLVANQLKVGTCEVDLALMRDIVQKMAGIEPFEDATDDQLEASMGGDLLKSEMGNLVQLKQLKKPAQRLRDSLAEASLATPLFLLVAKHRPTAVFKSPLTTHLKTLGKMFDECQETLLQYGSFLSNVLSISEYANSVPSLADLLLEFKVQPDSAFFVARPVLAGKIGENFKTIAKQLSSSLPKDGAKPDKESVEKLRTQAFSDAAKLVFGDLANTIKSATASNGVPSLPSSLWEELSCDLYVVFWTLDISDIYVPEGAYSRLEQKARNELKTAENELQAASNGSSSTMKAKAKERDRLRSALDKVVEERNRQREHVARVLSFLKEFKDRFFPTELLKRDIIANFLQYCVFPRLLFSQPDAVFCAKFISLLHSMVLNNFSTVHCLDRIFCDITYILSSLSEAESRRYGRFVASCLELVLQWHSGREVYDRECGTRFIISQSNSGKTPLDYENFRHLCHKWNYRISKAMVSCLESGQYVQIRNALVVLTKLLPVYPKVANHGQALEQRADRLSRAEKEHRADLYQLAFAYGGQLRNKKSSWVLEKDFHLTPEATPAANTGKAPVADGGAKEPAAKNAKADQPSKRTAPQSTANGDGIPAKRVPIGDSTPSSNSLGTPQKPAEEVNGHSREDSKRRRLENGQGASATSSPAHTPHQSGASTNGSAAPVVNGTVSNGNSSSSVSKKQSTSSAKEPKESNKDSKESSRQSGRSDRKRSSPTDKTQSDVIVPPVKQQHSAAAAGGHSPSPPQQENHRGSRSGSKTATSNISVKQSGGNTSSQTSRSSGGSGRRH